MSPLIWINQNLLLNTSALRHVLPRLFRNGWKVKYDCLFVCAVLELRRGEVMAESTKRDWLGELRATPHEPFEYGYAIQRPIEGWTDLDMEMFLEMLRRGAEITLIGPATSEREYNI
jgi:hypothetical protein